MGKGLLMGWGTQIGKRCGVIQSNWKVNRYWVASGWDPNRSVAYSPDGKQIISGSVDKTIRIWDAKIGAVLGTPLRGHSDAICWVSYSPSGRHIVSGSRDSTIRVWDSFAHLSTQPSSSCDPVHSQFFVQPNSDGWVRDLDGGLLYWVPPDCRAGLHAPSLLMITLTPDIRTVSLDFEDCAFGNSWIQIFDSAQP